MKVKGLRQFFWGCRWSRVGGGGRQNGSCGLGFGGTWSGWAVMAGICAAGISAGGCQRRCLGLGCWWARVTDEAKRRRQELVVCRAALPFEGLIYARSSVTPAPAFLAGAPACWSVTVRL